MKHETLILMLTATLAIGLAGCGRNRAGASGAADADKPAISVDNAAGETAAAAKAEAAIIDEAAKAEMHARVQGLIDKAAGLVEEGKFSDASKVLKQLAGLSLTSEQQKLVDALREQILKALAVDAGSNTAGTTGNLLKQ